MRQIRQLWASLYASLCVYIYNGQLELECIKFSRTQRVAKLGEYRFVGRVKE